MKPSFAGLIVAYFAASLSPLAHAAMPRSLIQHVLVISIDGMHAEDLDHFIRSHPDSTLAWLAGDGVEYTDAHTVVPADSFPGLLGMMTGGSPAVTGVYYDVTYAPQLASSEANCKAGHFGTTVAFDEAADGPVEADGQRSLNISRLPRRAGTCVPVYPHSYLRVNTVFDVIHAAGGYTAWIDKHPVYEILNGPSGHGVDDLYTPEIGGDYEGKHTDVSEHITGSIRNTERYDAMKARALINEIDGWTHDHTHRAPVPTLFGMNMQAINVAQKLAGYTDAKGAPSPGLEHAMQHCDDLLGHIIHDLRSRHLIASTLIIITAKHGNSPVNRALLRHVDKRALRHVINAAAPNVLAQLTVDQGALIWLRDAKDARQVALALRRHKKALGIQKVLYGPAAAHFFGAATDDSRTPNVVVIAQSGVIYAKAGATKLAEHGGFGDEDTHVALLLSNPVLWHRDKTFSMPVTTTQVAPSILWALNLLPDRLQAVKKQATGILPGLHWSKH